MEYLNDIREPLREISEENVAYRSIFECKDILYGFPYWRDKGIFNKFSEEVEKDKIYFSDSALREWENLKRNSSGCFLKFRTESEKIIIRVEVKRARAYIKMPLCNSSGLDFYEIDSTTKKYYHRKIIAPEQECAIFAEEIRHNPSMDICIYLPLYNEIVNLYIGTKYPVYRCDDEQRLKIAVYGNSITQGASASRSGNSFCNILSRKLNCEIYNLSVSSCCKGFMSIARMLGDMEIDAVVLDYSRNAENYEVFKNTYYQFYSLLREAHLNKPIVLMTTVCFDGRLKYKDYDKVIYDTYMKAKELQQNTYVLDQKELFDKNDYSFICIDGEHYVDSAMFRVAEKLRDLLKDIW